MSSNISESSSSAAASLIYPLPASPAHRLVTISPSFSTSFTEIERPQTASPNNKHQTTPSPANSRVGTPIPSMFTPLNYSFTFPCKTCMTMHHITYIQKDPTSKEYAVNCPDGCSKAYEKGKNFLKQIIADK